MIQDPKIHCPIIHHDPTIQNIVNIKDSKKRKELNLQTAWLKKLTLRTLLTVLTIKINFR